MELRTISALSSAYARLGVLVPASRISPLIIDEPKLREPALSAPDIASLTARMARGEEEAYRRFYALYFDRLLRYLLVVTGDEQLFALLGGRPAALVQRGPAGAELVFLNPADRDGFAVR